ncbi:PD-(D/E)XK nuclease family transposase [Faecalicatena contorta]|uniref:PD-(D/E)XK nuclease family transposase n=1 Tax=Faecalicatena contorta TaxID=39482 RepID=UPI001961047B|nr:PD-(D/E)XK nuclease family transposase [Faecalicatena contorta]MBM6686678.1 PD-(D/E)XK nuclease family transposase [Faecalicatena contorta]MBM6710858.1 PD-(D/E)XK nuclease family transposase [Faecalicatena contorta]
MAKAENEKSRLPARRERLEEIQGFTLLSDVFASEALKDLPACQHVFRILTGKRELCLRGVKTQYSISRAATRGARLDVFAQDVEGNLYAMEIQRRKESASPQRVRFYRAMADSESLEKGTDYAELPELDIFYVSETDIWQEGKTVYPVRSYLGDESRIYEDGSRIVFVNTEVDDQSEIAALMKYFKTADPEDDSQGALSARVRYLKCEEGGIELMCDIAEKIEQRGREAGRVEGREEGRLEAKHESACSLAEIGMPAEQIAKVLKESVSLVKEWIAEGAAPAK